MNPLQDFNPVSDKKPSVSADFSDREKRVSNGVKSKIKLFLIVALASVILVVAGILLLKAMQPAPVTQAPPPPAPSPQESSTTTILQGDYSDEERNVVDYLQKHINDITTEQLRWGDVFSVSKVEFYPDKKFIATLESDSTAYFLGGYSLGSGESVRITYTAGVFLSPPEPLDELKHVHNFEKIENSEWQTYRNAEFGFEVKYPANIFAITPAETIIYPDFSTKYSGSKFLYISEKERLGEEACSYGESGIVSICNAALEDGVNFVAMEQDISEFKNIEGEKLEIAGKEATHYGYGAEGYSRDYYYIPLDPGNTVVVVVSSTYRWGSRVTTPSRELVGEILSTFRFVE